MWRVVDKLPNISGSLECAGHCKLGRPILVEFCVGRAHRYAQCSGLDYHLSDCAVVT